MIAYFKTYSSKLSSLSSFIRKNYLELKPAKKTFQNKKALEIGQKILVDKIIYTITSSTQKEVWVSSSCKYNKTSYSLKIPKNIQINDTTFTVVGVENGAFAECGNLTSVSIPNSIKIIGDYAFLECNNLKSVNIPNSITHIGKAAFYYCSNLSNIIFETLNPSSLSVEDFAFNLLPSNCELTIPTEAKQKYENIIWNNFCVS